MDVKQGFRNICESVKINIQKHLIVRRTRVFYILSPKALATIITERAINLLLVIICGMRAYAI